MFTNDSSTPTFPENGIRGIFDVYITSMRGRNEICPSYHFGVLKTIIGASLGRSGYIYGARPLYPNFYSCLIGMTGISRKTTALFLGQDVLSQSDPTVIHLNGLATAEGLLSKLVTSNDDKVMDSLSESEGIRAIIGLSEFASLLKKAKKLSGDGLIQMLTLAYDMPPSLDNPTKVSPQSAKNPCVSIIALSTHEWLEESLELGDIRGGFANRFCYYLHDRMKPIPHPIEPDPELWDIVLGAIRKKREVYQQKSSRFRFDSYAMKFVENWYIYNFSVIMDEPNDLVRDVMQRVDTHARKLALLYAMLENQPDDYYIHLEQIKASVEVADYWKQSMIAIFGKYAVNEQAKTENRILQKLESKSISKRNLQRSLSVSAKQFNDALDALIKAERIVQSKNGLLQLL